MWQYTHFNLGEKPSGILDFTPYINPQNIVSPLFKGENKSFFRFRLKIKNIGSVPIENPKLIIQANGNYEEIVDENNDTFLITQKVRTDIEINDKKGNFYMNPHRNVFALEEEYISNLICIKLKIEGADIEIDWKLISNNFKKEGQLKIKIETCLIRKDVDKFVDFKTEVRVEKSIEDYIEEDEQ